jgi:hypothetical protein
MGNQQITTWREIRRQGRGRFLRWSILHAGVPFATFMAVINYFREHGLTTEGLISYVTGWWLYLGFLFGCLFYGLGMGLFFWHASKWFAAREERGRSGNDKYQGEA